MWVNRESDPLYDFELWPLPWPWPWFAKVKLKKKAVSQEYESIDMEWKGCELIGCWTHYVTLSYDLDLGLSILDSEIAVSKEYEGRLTGNERDVSG